MLYKTADLSGITFFVLNNTSSYCFTGIGENTIKFYVAFAFHRFADACLSLCIYFTVSKGVTISSP